MDGDTHRRRKEGCGLGKMKNELKEMMKYFDWEKMVIALIVSVAVAVFLVAIFLAESTGNLWYLMLWLVTAVCGGIVAGICG